MFAWCWLPLGASRAAVTGRSAATLAERAAGASGSASMTLVRPRTVLPPCLAPASSLVLPPPLPPPSAVAGRPAAVSTLLLLTATHMRKGASKQACCNRTIGPNRCPLPADTPCSHAAGAGAPHRPALLPGPDGAADVALCVHVQPGAPPLGGLQFVLRPLPAVHLLPASIWLSGSCHSPWCCRSHCVGPP